MKGIAVLQKKKLSIFPQSDRERQVVGIRLSDEETSGNSLSCQYKVLW